MKRKGKYDSKVLILLGIMVTVFLILAYLIVPILRDNFKALEKLQPSKNSLSASDSALFKPSALSKINAVRVVNIKGKSPITSLLYNNEYKIIVRRFEVTKNTLNGPISKWIDIQSLEKGRTNFVPYLEIQDGHYEIYIDSRTDSICSKISLFVGKGSEIKMTSDSLICLLSKVGIFSISTLPESSIDLSVERIPNSEGKFPVLAFVLRKFNDLIFILLFPKDPDNKIDQNLIKELFI